MRGEKDKLPLLLSRVFTIIKGFQSKRWQKFRPYSNGKGISGSFLSIAKSMEQVIFLPGEL
jgi:hypothetical protein